MKREDLKNVVVPFDSDTIRLMKLYRGHGDNRAIYKLIKDPTISENYISQVIRYKRGKAKIVQVIKSYYRKKEELVLS